jgi:hypothetical protein
MMNTAVSIFAVFALAAQASPQKDAAKLSVKFSQERLSVSAVEVPLKDLAQEIRKKSGIVVEVKDTKAAEKRMTLELNNAAPALALEEILRGLNFASFYENGRLSQVVVLSPEASPQKPAPAKPAQPRPQTVRRPADPVPDFEELLERNWAEGMRAIAQALKESDRNHKVAALEALDYVEHPEVFKLVSEALNDSDETVRKAALKVLTDKEGAPVMPLLKGALRDSDPSIRIEVLEALADKGELLLVKSALSDMDKDVRERAQDLLEREARQKDRTRIDEQRKGNSRRSSGK